MVLAITLLLLFQLVGEAITRGFGLPVPGPVIGFVLLALTLAASPETRRTIEPTAAGLLRNLSLLYVPAAVGVIQQWRLLRAEALPITVALFVSTWAALAVTALVFQGVSSLLRIEDQS